VAVRDGSELISEPRGPVTPRARVAEWQTQWTQNPPRATSCEFDSRLGHRFTAMTYPLSHPTARTALIFDCAPVVPFASISTASEIPLVHDGVAPEHRIGFPAAELHDDG
jgi:hypothetical protein